MSLTFYEIPLNFFHESFGENFYVIFMQSKFHDILHYFVHYSHSSALVVHVIVYIDLIVNTDFLLLLLLVSNLHPLLTVLFCLCVGVTSFLHCCSVSV